MRFQVFCGIPSLVFGALLFNLVLQRRRDYFLFALLLYDDLQIRCYLRRYVGGRRQRYLTEKRKTTSLPYTVCKIQHLPIPLKYTNKYPAGSLMPRLSFSSHPRIFVNSIITINAFTTCSSDLGLAS